MNAWLGVQLVILRVSTDPHPQKAAVHLYCEGPIVRPDTGRPNLAQFLEMKRGMRSIGFQQREVFVRECADIFGQGVIAGPKRGRSEMLQSGLVFPARCSASACSIRGSSFPEFASASICRSHRAFSYSMNQARNAAKPLSSRASMSRSIDSILLIAAIPMR